MKYVSKEEALDRHEEALPGARHGPAVQPAARLARGDADEGASTSTSVAASLRPLPPGVAKIETRQAATRARVLQVAHVIEVIFTIATAILLVAATMLIANTIRLSIFSRRREIEVMKLVGATNWFVRGPFMIEGLLCGLGGAALAVFFLVLGKEVALPAICNLELSNDPDVHALAFPLTALILLGDRPRARRARLRAHAAPLPPGLAADRGAVGLAAAPGRPTVASRPARRNGRRLRPRTRWSRRRGARRRRRRCRRTVVVEVARRGKLVVGEPYFTPGVPIVLDVEGARRPPRRRSRRRPPRPRARARRARARAGATGSRTCSRRCSSSRARASSSSRTRCPSRASTAASTSAS